MFQNFIWFFGFQILPCVNSIFQIGYLNSNYDILYCLDSFEVINSFIQFYLPEHQTNLHLCQKFDTKKWHESDSCMSSVWNPRNQGLVSSLNKNSCSSHEHRTNMNFRYAVVVIIDKVKHYIGCTHTFSPTPKLVFDIHFR